MEKLDGINTVIVEVETGAVTVNYDEKLEKPTIVNSLSKMGYPEKGTSNNLQKAKFFVSCAI
ncbi:MAG: copper chaperone [Paraglaciecola sp.]